MNIVRLISYLTGESQKVLLVLEFLPNIMAHVCLARGRGRSKDARMNCSSAFCDTSLKSADLNISRSFTELLNGFRQTSVIVRVFIWRA